jgi:hypothetical protein
VEALEKPAKAGFFLRHSRATWGNA